MAHRPSRSVAVLGLQQRGQVIGAGERVNVFLSQHLFSRGQRTDLGPMALVKAAFTTGVLRVTHPETSRAYLWLEDQVVAFATIIERFQRSSAGGAPNHFPRFALYNLISFNSNVAALAAAIAARTGARIDMADHRPAKDVAGFSLDGAALSAAFGFTPRGTLAAAVDDLVSHVPESVTAKGVVRAI